MPQDVKEVDTRFLHQRFGRAVLRVALRCYQCSRPQDNCLLSPEQFQISLCRISSHLANPLHVPAMICITQTLTNFVFTSTRIVHRYVCRLLPYIPSQSCDFLTFCTVASVAGPNVSRAQPQPSRVVRVVVQRFFFLWPRTPTFVSGSFVTPI